MNIYSLCDMQEELKMPNRDGTGPQGEGPKTGAGKGRCGDNETPKPEGRGPCGKGLRKGLGNRWKQD